MADAKEDPGTNQASKADEAEAEAPRGFSRGSNEAIHFPNPRSYANAEEYERAMADRAAADEARDRERTGV